MLKVTLASNSFNLQQRIITWAIEPASETYSLYKMDLYRGETFAQTMPSYELVVSGLDFTNLYSYTDISISGMHLHSSRGFWYKAYIYNTYTGEAAWTREITNEPVADYATRTIWREKNLGLRERYGGRRFVVLKRKTYGDSCPVCWDTYTQRRLIDFCETCYDTGISGGFYQPISVLCTMNAALKRHQMLLWGSWETGDAVIYTFHHPHIEPKDIFVDLYNRRWEVVQVRKVEKGLAIIEQDAQVRRIPKDDVVYNVEVSGYFTTSSIYTGEKV